MYESMLSSRKFLLQGYDLVGVDINIPRSFVYQYARNSASSSQNNTQQPVYVSLEANLPCQIVPAFQRKFPFISVAILGFFESICGLTVLALELIIFDITLGLWCGGIYAIAGAAIIVLGLFDRTLTRKNLDSSF